MIWDYRGGLLLNSTVKLFSSLGTFLCNEGVENNGEAGGQELKSSGSAPQLSGFTALPEGMSQMLML